MTQYVENPDGGIQSVNDDFRLEDQADWHGEGALITETEARSKAPWLFGEPHPAVVAAEIHENGAGIGHFPVNEAEIVAAVETAIEAEDATK